MGEDSKIEETAVRVLRTARRTCEEIGGVGYRFVGLADWLETQIPRVRQACTEAVRAAVKELTRTGPPGDER